MGESNHSYYEQRGVATGLLSDSIAPGEARIGAFLCGKPGTLLDVGCGSGRLHSMFDRVGHVGVDYSMTQLSLYHEHHPSSLLVQASALALPFQSGSFNFVVMSYHLIESILPREAREQALRESARVLARGGVLILTRHRRIAYRLGPQIAVRLRNQVSSFGDLPGAGVSRAGQNDLRGFTMHIQSSSEMRRSAARAGLRKTFSWDFDTGMTLRLTSRAVVEGFSAV